MSPARYPDSGSLGRSNSVIRNVMIVCGAAVVGTIVGGASVLAVVLAVAPPSDNHQLRYESQTAGGKTDAAATPHPIVKAPEATAPASAAAPDPGSNPAPSAPPTPAATAPAERQAQPVAPVETQTLPPAAPQPAPSTEAQSLPPAKVLRHAWPDQNDALAKYARHGWEAKITKPAQAPAAASAPAEQTSTPPADDNRNAATEPGRPVRRAVSSRAMPPAQLPDGPAAPTVVYPRRRAVVIQPNVPPPPVQAEAADGGPPAAGPRPLFDFFGLFDHRRYDDNRYGDGDYNSGYRDNWNGDRRW